jgi:transposase
MLEVLSTVENSIDTVLYALDETYIRNESNNYKSWSPKGVAPVIERNGSHKGLNIVGATEITKQFDCIVDCYSYDESITSSKVIAFLQNLLNKNKSKKVLVILDNAKNHKSKAIKKFVNEHTNELELIYLPPYSPELNPQENIWNKLKRCLFMLRSRTCIDELFCNLASFLDKFNANIEEIKSIVYGRNYYNEF